MHGRRGHVGLTIRVDLVDEAHDQEVAAMLAARVALDRPARVVVVVFTDAAGRMPRRELVETVCDGMPVPVDDALLMRAGRWWSYSCADDDCCPAEGRAVDTGSSAAL